MASNDSALLALLLLSVIILTAVQPSVGLTKPSGVKLVNNEYTGLVVAIHPDEEENSKIIDIIKVTRKHINLQCSKFQFEVDDTEPAIPLLFGYYLLLVFLLVVFRYADQVMF